VIGTVSHTASYLRLWALSLAHQQLGLVFLQKILLPALTALPSPFNSISIIIGFAIFFQIVLFVLMAIDIMECFLHTLRLHWVEFQSKFFKGDGRLFVPFRHFDVLNTQTD
jgi:V-type H+-transporting ATPase subunit a